MSTHCPVLFLARIAAVPVGLALRANLEVLQMANNLAPDVAAIHISLQQFSAKLVEFVDWIPTPLLQPVHHAGQDIRGNLVNPQDPSRRRVPRGIPYVPNLTGVGTV